jgi:crotonobetainyl-CoA:carnitine CoA-transferase CaiB-like acyl-CoA transferase
LIQLSISGFGHSKGPRSHYAAYGATVSSFIGLTRLWGYGSQTYLDYVAQAHGALAILGALAARDQTGHGMFIDLAMVEAASSLMGPAVLDWTVNGRVTTPPGNRIPGSVWSGVVRCPGEDRWIAIEAVSEPEWTALASIVGFGGAASDDAGIRPALANWLANKTPFQAARLLQHAGVPAAPVQNTEDLFRDPQLRARGSLVEIPHPDLGPVEFLAPVHRLSRTPGVVRGGAPRLGEHGSAIIGDWLHRDPRARQKLAADGAYWLPDVASAAFPVG